MYSAHSHDSFIKIAPQHAGRWLVMQKVSRFGLSVCLSLLLRQKLHAAARLHHPRQSSPHSSRVPMMVVDKSRRVEGRCLFCCACSRRPFSMLRRKSQGTTGNDLH